MKHPEQVREASQGDALLGFETKVFYDTCSALSPRGAAHETTSDKVGLGDETVILP